MSNDDRVLQKTKAGKPIDWFVDEQVDKGKWVEETIPADVVGLSRPMTVHRAARKTNLITHDWHGDKDTFCPPIWWDLAIGSGACGLGCRACFLMLTFRAMRDPYKHLLYNNTSALTNASESWLKSKKRKRFHTLGVGIDRSDSLLYEGVTEQVRQLAPLFGSEKHNPNNCKLILLTKSTNTGYLEDIDFANRGNVVVTFSLNPEPIADLWEGKYPDGERITPPIHKRLQAAAHAQDLGYEVRARIDPILTPKGWVEEYLDFFAHARRLGIDFRYWTLGTYREKNSQLQSWGARWGLLEMEWQPEDNELVKDGTHWHLSVERRVEIYRAVRGMISSCYPDAKVSLCKESNEIRKALRLCNSDCNCLR